MDRDSTTIETFPPRKRGRGLALVPAALAVAGIGIAGYQVRRAAGLERRLVAETRRATQCGREREALTKEAASLRERAVPPPPPAPPSLLALRAKEPGAEHPKVGPVESGLREAPSGPPPSQQVVLGVIRGGQVGLQACYQKALRHDPALGLRPLRLQLSFTVRAAGDVGRIAFKPSPGGELSRCLRGVVDDWRVPPFGGAPIAVEVPITLSPQG